MLFCIKRTIQKINIFAICLLLAISAISPLLAEGWFRSVDTDRARYAPGDTVKIRVRFLQLTENKNLMVRYRHLGEVVAEQNTAVSSSNYLEFSWQPPETDYTGYLTEIFLMEDGAALDQINIAIDVSSDWKHFPRYGFLSKYPFLDQNSVDAILSQLNRFHINGLQFYDWHYKHHMPLKGTVQNPAPTWNDIANRTNYYSTVKRYIDTAHSFNMQCMAYNLLYGSWEDAPLDGVSDAWRLFKDTNHTNPDLHPLPDSWASDIYVMDPTNSLWEGYLFSKTAMAFEVFDFDGWHVDQLGNRGALYNYQGGYVSLADSFESFLNAAKNSLSVDLVMNAVNQYGQPGIANSPVDFLYTEVWDPNRTYTDLASIITRNSLLSNNSLNTVLAAYVNKGLSDAPGYVNPPAILMADAVIFAAGGAHIELGEHILASEYFPNDNLRMSDALQTQLTCYYDFMVAYENVLRDGGEFNMVYLNSTGNIPVKSLAQKGTVWTFSKRVQNYQVFHMINLADATTMDWRDDSGQQAEPDTIFNLPLFFNTTDEILNVWAASPDFSQGSPVPLNYSQDNGQVSFTLPELKYWSMIVVEYKDPSVLRNENSAEPPEQFHLGNNYPNPFNPSTVMELSLKYPADVELTVFNSLGQRVETLVHSRLPAGIHGVKWIPANGVGTGLYFVSLKVDGNVIATRKMIYVK